MHHEKPLQGYVHRRGKVGFVFLPIVLVEERVFIGSKEEASRMQTFVNIQEREEGGLG